MATNISLDAALAQVHLATMDGERTAFEVGKETQEAARALREATEKKLKDLERELDARNKDVRQHSKEGESWWEGVIGSNRHEEEGKSLEAKVDETHADIEGESVSLTEAREEIRAVVQDLTAAADKMAGSFDRTLSMMDASKDAYDKIVG